MVVLLAVDAKRLQQFSVISFGRREWLDLLVLFEMRQHQLQRLRIALDRAIDELLDDRFAFADALARARPRSS